jgi:hypothetical protein
VLHYHLSRSSLYKAQQQGLDAAGVIALLEEASGRELPQNVRYSLLDWQRQHERITIHDGAALCQVADPALLDALCAWSPQGSHDRSAQQHPSGVLSPKGPQQDERFPPPTQGPVPPAVRRSRAWPQHDERFPQGAWKAERAAPEALAAPEGPAAPRRLAPDVAILPAAHLEALRRELESRGYIARSLAGIEEAEYAQPALRSLSVTAEGEITVQGPLASLYLRGELDRFADRDPQRGPRYTLTPASLRRAVQEGLSVAAIVAWLEGRCGDALPPALVDRLKSWSGHYGTVALERHVVVRLQSPEVLVELLTDAAIGPLLVPLAPAAGLAGVAEENLDGLRRVLAAKGIAVDDRS